MVFALMTSNNTTTSSSKLLIAGGQIIPVLSKFFVSGDELSTIWRQLLHTVHPGDLLVLVMFSFFTVPLLALTFGFKSDNHSSYMFQLASHISQAAKLAIVVYIFDCAVVVLHTMGFGMSLLSTISKGLAKILYICWLAQRFSVFKRHLLSRAVSKKTDKLGRAATIDRLADGFIFVCTGFFLLDVLDVDMGVGITSVFAFGSAGTLVIGLASQNLASMFVNGLVLTTSDRIAEGDHIKFGNGNNGQIKKIGWFQTTLKHYDELVEVIPNSELGMQRVTNISRVDRCRVQQKLRFRYEDGDKLEEMLPDILKEIKASCPQVITDGSAPFRAYWSAFKEDHLQVTVNVHFEGIKPIGEKFQSNRQECLKAIYRAVKRNKVEFVSGLYPQGIN